MEYIELVQLEFHKCCTGHDNPTVYNTLTLTFDDIDNADAMIGGDSSNITDWNIFFDLPGYGNEFISVSVVGNVVTLTGGKGITLKNYLFGSTDLLYTSLLEVVDTGCVIACGDGVFSDQQSGEDLPGGCYALTKVHLPYCKTIGKEVFLDCELLTDLILPFDEFTILGAYTFFDTGLSSFNFPNLVNAGYFCFGLNPNLTSVSFPILEVIGAHCFESCPLVNTFNFPNLITVGDYCFFDDQGMTSLNIPNCLNLGSTTGNDNVFGNITGKTITITVPAALMTCNGGGPDGDIAWLQANNTVTAITV